MTRDEIIKGLEKEIRRIHREPKRKMLGIFMTVDEAEDIVAMLKEQANEYENGFNDAMLGKQELIYEGTDGKWHKKDW